MPPRDRCRRLTKVEQLAAKKSQMFIYAVLLKSIPLKFRSVHLSIFPKIYSNIIIGLKYAHAIGIRVTQTMKPSITINNSPEAMQTKECQLLESKRFQRKHVPAQPDFSMCLCAFTRSTVHMRQRSTFMLRCGS